MTLKSVPARDLPGLNPIARGHATGDGAVRELLPDAPDRGTIERRAAEVVDAFRGRRHTAHPLGEGRSAVVLTGQQAGLFLGPLLVPVKAAATILLARDLAARGVPMEAGFWCASEDHDLVEVTRVGLPAESGVREAGPDPEPLRANRRPVGALPVPLEAAAILESARDGLGAAADPEALEHLCAATILRPGGPGDGAAGAVAIIRPGGPGDGAAGAVAIIRPGGPGDGAAGPTFREAFQATLGWLFEGQRLSQVEAADPALKPLAVPLAARLVRERAEVRRLLEERASRLRAHALPLQVTTDPSALPLFAIVEGQRYLLVDGPGGLRLKGHVDESPLEPEDVVARFEAGAWLPSFSALSRPVLASFLFPVAATILGPAEIAYWAQAFPLFGWAGVLPPVIVPRPMVAPITPATARSLEKLQVGLAEVVAGAESILRARGGRRAGETVGGVQQLRERTLAELSRLSGPLEEVDASLGKAVAMTREKVDFALAKLAERAAEAAGRADEAYARQVARVMAALAPGGVAAERAHSTLPYLLRQGRAGLVEPLLAQLRWDGDGLQPLVLP